MKQNKKRQWKSVAFMIFLSVFVSGSLFAQSVRVTGKVTQASDGSTLPGVTVTVKGENTGTITNIDGAYSIDANANATLVFSFVGYIPQEVAVGGKSTVNVALEPDVVNLGEFVAVGYGVVKKSDLTGSVGSIDSEALNLAPISSLDAGLQGKIAGVSIQNTTGAPGQKMKIRIRGGSSINYSNEPLYVIDGFIGADITSVNPNDIASIDILKDASATAVYGNRGANGVVIITTNSPQKGDLKVSFDANVGVSNMVNQYEILEAGEMARLINEQDGAKGLAVPFSDADIAELDAKGGTDWVDLVTRQGVKQNYTLNLTGGNDRLQYYFSGNHLDDQGVINESFYKRTSLRSNIAGKISEWIDFKFNTYATHTDSQNNGRGTAGKGNTIGQAVLFPQVWSPRFSKNMIGYDRFVSEGLADKYEEGDIIDPNDYDSYNGRYLTGREVHPEQKAMQNQETYSDKIYSNIDLTFQLTNDLSLQINNSGMFNSGFHGQRTLIDNINVDRAGVTAQQTYTRQTRWINTDMLNYDKDFGLSNLKVTALYEWSQAENRFLSANVGSMSTLGNEWYLLGNGQPTTTSTTYSDPRTRSYMARVNYSYADKYLLTASMRRDGTSVFQEDYRWGNFPSAALAWRASEEDFIKDLDFVHNLKVRAGFGSTGNMAVGAYATLPAMDTSTGNAKYRYYIFNGIPVEGVIPGPYTDPNLQWETTTQYNAGLDLAILDGRLSATLDLYSKQSTDVIIAKSIPRYTGHQAYTSNLADIDNNGFELAIDWHIMDDRDFSWDANFNISRNVNIVRDLGITDGYDEIFIADEEPIGIWSLVGGNSKYIVQEGESMGRLYGLKAIGLWQADQADEAAGFGSQPGEVRYEDVDGDGTYSASDRQVVGETTPEFVFGLGTNLNYKNFDLSISCVGSYGNDIYNWSREMLNQQRVILSTDYRERWTPETPDAPYQNMPIGNDYTLTYVVSQYIEDGSFFKISNVTLGYTLPTSLTNKLKIGSVRFYASANNLLTFTNYTGLDPEASSTPLTSDSQSGIDAFSYPLTRTITGGVKINF